MTPIELKNARQQLGLSAQAFARLIGVHDGRTVRRWEAGDAPIPGLLPLYLNLRQAAQAVIDEDRKRDIYRCNGPMLALEKNLQLPAKRGLTPRA